MSKRLFVLVLAAVACNPDVPTQPIGVPGLDAAFAKAPPTLYKLRFITGVNPAGDGEIQSGWIPAAGISINASNPWKSIGVTNVRIDLVNFTHGSWTEGTCGTFQSAFSVNPTTWDIAGTEPILTFAGTWSGALSISQTASPTSIGFDGDRVVNGVVTPSAGGIHNVVTNGNAAIQTKDPSGNNDWFRLEIRSAAMKFGSASRADGVNNPVGAEVACANFTIEARKVSLIIP